MTVQVFLNRPRDFNSSLEAAGVFCEYDGRLLYLKRHGSKVEGLRWGIPGGKLEAGEKPLQAAMRELAEETGIKGTPEFIKTVGVLYLRRPEVDFIFHLFFLALTEMPLLQVAPDEHLESAWVTLKEGFNLPLISGGRETLDYFLLWHNAQNFKKKFS